MQPPSQAVEPSSERRATPKTVLVTGGTGAIGSEIVRCLSPSWRVVAGYARDEQRARRLQHETGCELARADVGDEAQVEAMFAALEMPLFAVIHAAGVARDALLLRQSREQWNQTLRVNCDGSFLVARAALRCLDDGGRLILLASRVGESGVAGQGAYAASKAATLALMRCAAREGASRHIAVNAICPGWVLSQMSGSVSAERKREVEKRSVLASPGTPREVVGAVEWLLGSEAAAISAQSIHCDSRI